MHLKVADAHALAIAALRGAGCNADEARATAGHLVDAGLRGMTFGSLARVLAIRERLEAYPGERTRIELLHQTPVSALLDGGDRVGYYVAEEATKLAIEKARGLGIALVGARNTWYTGLFSYYMEMITSAGFVGFAIGNGPAIVAPQGSAEPRLGTNPMAWGFPCQPDPVIWDIGTCAIMHGELLLHTGTGEPLPEGVALDRAGNPTTDPVAALSGIVLPFGGHRGSGLSMVVQMLGAMCGGPVITPGKREMAYLVLAIDPKILMPDDEYADYIAELSEAIRGARPSDPAKPVRMPFDRSAHERRQRLADDAIEVPDTVHASLLRLAALANTTA